MIRIKYTLAVLLFGLISCETSTPPDMVPDTPEDPLILSFTVEENYLSADDRAYYIIKGEDGTTLDFGAYSNGDSFEIKLPYELDKVAFTSLVSSDLANRLNIDSYLDIPVGQSFVLAAKPPFPDAQATLKFSNLFDGYDEISISNANVALFFPATALDNGQEFSFKYHLDDPYTIVTTTHTIFLPRYQTLELNENEVFEINLDQSEAMAQSHTISTFESDFDHNITLSGISTDLDSYRLYQINQQSIGNNLIIYTPPIFEDFRVTIELIQNENTYSQITTGTIPESFEQTDPTIDVLSPIFETMEIQATGEVSYTRSFWRSSGSNNIFWHVFSDAELQSNYNLHEIPESILAAEDELDDLDNVVLIYTDASDVNQQSYGQIVQDLLQDNILENSSILTKRVNF